MVPSESASKELSNEWSCLYVKSILTFLTYFCVTPFVTEVAISPKIDMAVKIKRPDPKIW
jgi:hypothetical protein